MFIITPHDHLLPIHLLNTLTHNTLTTHLLTVHLLTIHLQYTYSQYTHNTLTHNTLTHNTLTQDTDITLTGYSTLFITLQAVFGERWSSAVVAAGSVLQRAGCLYGPEGSSTTSHSHRGCYRAASGLSPSLLAHHHSILTILVFQIKSNYPVPIFSQLLLVAQKTNY